MLEISMNLVQTKKAENEMAKLSIREIENIISSAIDEKIKFEKSTICEIIKFERKTLKEPSIKH